MPWSRTLAAALAAALAVPAAAQTRVADEARRAAERRNEQGQPGAPAAAPAAGAATQQGQAQQLSQEHLQAVATVVARNDLSMRVGDLASTRATTPELQGLGRQLAEDHRRIALELARLLAERGAQSLPGVPEQERIEGEFGRLNALTGPEFDRELTEFLTRNVPQFVESLKRARDLTPGKDAGFKKFLDDAENTEENHLAAARKVKANRQARTPPPR